MIPLLRNKNLCAVDTGGCTPPPPPEKRAFCTPPVLMSVKKQHSAYENLTGYER